MVIGVWTLSRPDAPRP